MKEKKFRLTWNGDDDDDALCIKIFTNSFKDQYGYTSTYYGVLAEWVRIKLMYRYYRRSGNYTKWGDI